VVIRPEPASPDGVGEIGHRPIFRMTWVRWKLENAAPHHELRIRSPSTEVKCITGTDLIGSLVDVLFSVRVIELMEGSFHTPVITKIEGRVYADSAKCIGPVVRTPKVK
jgi:hypothetical protein